MSLLEPSNISEVMDTTKLNYINKTYYYMIQNLNKRETI